MMLLSFIEQGNLVHAAATGGRRLQLQPPLVLPGYGGRFHHRQRQGERTLALPVRHGSCRHLPALAIGQGAFPCNYDFCHGVNDATACLPGSRRHAGHWRHHARFPRRTGRLRRQHQYPHSRRHRRHAEHHDDGRSANGAYTATPKWTVCNYRFCTAADTIPQPLYWLIGSPLKAGTRCRSAGASTSPPRPATLSMPAARHYRGIRGGWVMACTMEPINKNPVTGSYGLYISGDKSSLTAPARGRTPAMRRRFGLLPHAMAAPATCHASMSNFRSDHPSGALFLFCDGHVQFLNENIDMAYLHRLVDHPGRRVGGPARVISSP